MMRLAILTSFLTVTSANALDFSYYNTFPVSPDKIVLKSMSHLIPVEVRIDDTDAGYLIACALYAEDGTVLKSTWGFAEIGDTSFFFRLDAAERDIDAVKCIRTDGLTRKPVD